MSIKAHLLDGEEVLAYCLTDNWAWVCTDDRLVKYRKSDGGVESLSDVSFGEIGGISLTNEPRDNRWLVFSLITGLLGLMAFSEIAALGGLLFLAALWMGSKYMNSERSYFQLKGSGVIMQEPEEWRIQNSGDSNESVREFVKALRSRL